MPFIKCPICGSTMHLNVKDPEAWYKERYPNLKPGTLIPEKCIDCFPELKVGDEVELKLKLGQYQVERGSIGRIVELFNATAGTLYAVSFEQNGKKYSEIFCRPEIAKVRNRT